ncbi:MAG: GGDEF domain-containing phosphodiesterase, partial [Pseudomonadota bacterium]
LDVLMKNADQAMYVGKNSGRNRYSNYTPALHEASQIRLRLTNDLRRALVAQQFSLYFQPIVELLTGRIHKVEALIRWNHPTLGMVHPQEFIALAEETGLINEMGDWVFKTSSRYAKDWCSRFDKDFQVSVNVSPLQFRAENPVFPGVWMEHLNALDLQGGSIILEITEGLLLNAEPAITDRLHLVRDAKIQVAIDDFGTGYSSLSYLKKFRIDYLKIDQSFVHDLETDASDMILIEAIILMAHKLGIKVIAEGVETEGQRNLLAVAGCDYAQGYLFYRPMPPEELEKLLLTKASKRKSNNIV